MADIWQNRDEVLSDVELVGFEARTTDGEVAGDVASTTYTAEAAYLVLDIRRGRSLVVPAAVIERVDPLNEVVRLTCDQKQLENAPAHEVGRAVDSQLLQELGRYWDDVAGRPLG